MMNKRPVIKNVVNEKMTEMEIFQNKTLRPVIKMQHDLLISAFKNYLQKRKVVFLELTDQKKKSKIANIFKTDNNYKNINLGYIIGHFSEDEFNFYTKNSSEINRRILQIISQRVKDSLLEIA
ncbi:glyoxalase [Polaribacter aestuariivivens]|uniref:glyoxalase n=1 Tax=Polaribacter aestuariivivens TaxID=2304626 RepID=UPI003F49A695